MVWKQTRNFGLGPTNENRMTNHYWYCIGKYLFPHNTRYWISVEKNISSLVFWKLFLFKRKTLHDIQKNKQTKKIITLRHHKRHDIFHFISILYIFPKSPYLIPNCKENDSPDIFSHSSSPFTRFLSWNRSNWINHVPLEWPITEH